MTLGPGTRLGPYEILSALGAGGMGEVYRATDTTLGRQVAIKVLPDAFAQDADRLARFEREAKTLAALNHPHIAQIYGLEKSSGVQALVMELVEGEDLSQRIARGPISIDEALPMAKQIAEALEAAHEQGIIHRDLKPANVKVRPDGTVKVLDFGLAKLNEPAGSGQLVPGSAHLSLSPTITSPAMMTGVGMLLGTAAYMSPEQAKGRPADKRSDVWAFGCVLFEMLTGRRSFDGDDATDVIAAIVRGEPEWAALPQDTPQPLRMLLRNCLQKDRNARAADMAAALFVLKNVDQFAIAGATPARAGRWWSPRASTWVAIAGTAVVAVLATAGALRWMTTSVSPEIARFEILPPPGEVFVGAIGIPRFAVSRDGRSVVFAAGNAEKGPYQLWVRRLDRVDAQPLRSTATANPNSVQGMFWLPDGRTVGYFDEIGHQMRTVDVDGDVVRTLVEVPSNQYSGAANDTGVILYSSLGTGGLMKVPASGGVPQSVTTLGAGELAHLWPSFLPDGRHFVYLAQKATAEDWGIYAGSLDSSDQKLLVQAGGMALFSAPDRLLFMRGDALFAQRLDVGSLAMRDEPVLASGVATGNDTPVTASWVDGSGKAEPLGTPVHAYTHVRQSPDGKRIVLSAKDLEADLWVWNIDRKTLTRLTFGRWADTNPVWTPDSQRIFFQSDVSGHFNVYSIAADGTGMPERLLDSRSNQRPSSVSPDGKELIIEEDTLKAGTDLRAISLDGSRRIRDVLGEPFNQRYGAISPDGRWFVYQSNESGRNEIYVRPYPNVTAGRWQVSADGGNQPLWTRDGKELVYISYTGVVISVQVDATSTWAASAPKAIVTEPELANTTIGGALGATAEGVIFDVAADRRLLVLKSAAPPQAAQSTRLVVVLNWQQELTRFAPPRN